MTRTQTGIYGTPITHSVSPACFEIIWKGMGLPDNVYGAFDCPSLDAPDTIWHRNVKQPNSLGSCLTMPIKQAVIPYLDELTPEAQAMGSVNTTFFREDATGNVRHVGTNLDAKGIENSLLSALLDSETPFSPEQPRQFGKGKVAGVVIGGGGAARACIYALNGISVSPILLVNRDPSETESIQQQYGQLDLQSISSESDLQTALDKLRDKNLKLAIAIGAIPNIPPETPEEHMVHTIAQAVLSQTYDASVNATDGSSLALPPKPIFLDMCYKPRMTPFRTIAENNGWKTICGADLVGEVCFEQAQIWTGRPVPEGTREDVRRMLRKE